MEKTNNREAPVKSSRLQPVQLHERMVSLDVIRGFALLGILLVNMSFFSYPVIYLELAGMQMWTDWWDRAALGFINILAEGKFYSMFSFLFGLGFMIFLERARKKAGRPLFVFFRRLLVLLLIGLVHAFYIWFGDILVSYAVLGFFLPLFYARRPRAILIWVAVFFIIAVVPVMLSVASPALLGEEAYAEYMRDFSKAMEERVESSLYAYGEGSLAELHAHRVEDTLFTYQYAVFAFPLIFPMFLLGLYTGRKKILENVEAHLPLIRKVWKWGLVLGLSMSLVKYGSSLLVDSPASFYELVAMIARVLGDPALCFFYMSSLVLLLRSDRWKRRLLPLAAVGRMALSNYLLQSLLCTAIFYSYGGGLYGEVGPAAGLLLTIAIFGLQLFWSNLWLQKYRFGPMEWVWRTLTYGKKQPLLLTGN